MRKMSAYARKMARNQAQYRADNASIYKVMSRIQPFQEDEQNRLKWPVRYAFERMRTGAAQDDDFHTLAAVSNITMVASEKIHPDALAVALAAKAALLRTYARHKSTGVWGFDGPALTEIQDCIDLHEQLIELQTPHQLKEAMQIVLARMDAGEIEE